MAMKQAATAAIRALSSSVTSKSSPLVRHLHVSDFNLFCSTNSIRPSPIIVLLVPYSSLYSFIAKFEILLVLMWSF